MSRNSMNPLPSLVRASSWDAGNMSMRRAGRSKWNEDDLQASIDCQEKLITGCYGRKDDADPRTKYIRFSVAEQLERQGSFTFRTDFRAVLEWIDEYLAAPAEQAA